MIEQNKSETMREQFEKLPEIEQGLRHCHYNESTNDYCSDVFNEETHEWHAQYVNGAWYAFQEQQKKIDSMLDHVCGSFEDFK